MLASKNTVPSSFDNGTVSVFPYSVLPLYFQLSAAIPNLSLFLVNSSSLYFSIAISARYSTLQPSSRCPRYEVSGVAMQIWICGSPSIISPCPAATSIGPSGIKTVGRILLGGLDHVISRLIQRSNHRYNRSVLILCSVMAWFRHCSISSPFPR